MPETAWMSLVKKIKSENPTMKLKEILKKASVIYKKK
jgi:hypothetical protein